MTLKYWFKARKHGVGWKPHTWQGWTVLAVYLIALVYSFFQINGQSQSVSDTVIGFVPQFFLFTALLSVVTYLKGEPTSWRAAEKKEQEKAA